MDDLISREKLEEDMYEACFAEDYYFQKGMQKWDGGNWIRYKVFEEILAKQPSAEKTGRWVKMDGCDTAYCSECLEDFDYTGGLYYLCHGQELPNYCPNCGARMKE